MYSKALTAVAVISLATTGCKTDSSVGQAPDVTLTQLTELPEPEVIQFATIAPLERLEISVPQDSALSATYLVDEDGFINFPYLGRVRAAGLTPNAIAYDIESRLASGFLVNPAVNVVPTNVTPPSVSIGGQVSRPGSFPARDSMTLLRGINLAGGTTEYAKLDDILIFRSANGQKFIGIYNLGAIARGNYTDPEIFPGDIIMVGDSPGRRRFENYLQIFGAVSAPVILIDRLSR